MTQARDACGPAGVDAGAPLRCGYPSPIVRLAVPLVLLFAFAAHAQDSLQWSGFALLRGATEADSGPLEHEPVTAQLQLGLDWTPSPMFNAHAHFVARDDRGTRRGTFGIAEAYAELNLRPSGDRLRLRGGAFFLPTSRENVDALWENPYAITSSALNSWLGEEFRPIGLDATYMRGKAFGGATVFRGNDTFGAIPPVRGWTLDDHWTLLGEWVPVDPDYFTSLSAENDKRLGWSARGGWNGDRLFVQLTHIDNRSDGIEYGPLFNWGTRFDIVAAETIVNNWTIAAEYGWGPTFLIVDQKYTNDISAAYLMLSHRWQRARATVRLESFTVDDIDREAITFAYFFSPRPKLRLGAEVTAAEGDTRALLEVRYHVSGR
jgi:hypothetical protein